MEFAQSLDHAIKTSEFAQSLDHAIKTSEFAQSVDHAIRTSEFTTFSSVLNWIEKEALIPKRRFSRTLVALCVCTVKLTTFKKYMDIDIFLHKTLDYSDLLLVRNFLTKWNKVHISISFREDLSYIDTRLQSRCYSPLNELLDFVATHDGWFTYMNKFAYTSSFHQIDGAVRKSIVIPLWEENGSLYTCFVSGKKGNSFFLPEMKMTWDVYHKNADPYRTLAIKTIEEVFGKKVSSISDLKSSKTFPCVGNFLTHIDGKETPSGISCDLKANIYCIVIKNPKILEKGLSQKNVKKIRLENFKDRKELYSQIKIISRTNTHVNEKIIPHWYMTLLPLLHEIHASPEVFAKEKITSYKIGSEFTSSNLTVDVPQLAKKFSSK
jgi:hypothetical protein